jgi:excisionase family DNA binding protein
MTPSDTFTEQVSASPRIDRLLTPRQVAVLLQVTPRTVCRYAAEGRLQRVKIGARLSRYTVESVEQLIGSTNDQGEPGKVPLGESEGHGLVRPE